jgi:hypothetical protein
MLPHYFGLIYSEHGGRTFLRNVVKHCQVLGVCVTYKTGLGFDDRIY